mmetsp:Transcript_10264/g.14743  ORF Transcript_10264/g.14743 Transcript_10264/m.14743 type:complete len:88 (-) Transcript_10264:53-316(-)
MKKIEKMRARVGCEQYVTQLIYRHYDVVYIDVVYIKLHVCIVVWMECFSFSSSSGAWMKSVMQQQKSGSNMIYLVTESAVRLSLSQM